MGQNWPSENPSEAMAKVRLNAHAAGNVAESAFREPEKKASQQTGFVVLDAFESRHRLTSDLRSCHGRDSSYTTEAIARPSSRDEREEHPVIRDDLGTRP